MGNNIFVKLTAALMLTCTAALAYDDDGVGEDISGEYIFFESDDPQDSPSQPQGSATSNSNTSNVKKNFSFNFSPPVVNQSSAQDTAAQVKAQTAMGVHSIRGLLKIITTTVGRSDVNFKGGQGAVAAYRSRFTGNATSLKYFSANNSNKSYEATLAALANNGPVSVTADQNTFWMTPYASNSRISENTTAKGHALMGGAMIGYERKGQNNAWKAGLFVGHDKGHYKVKAASVDGTSKATLVDNISGVYGEAKITENLSARLTAVHIASRFVNERTNLTKINESTFNVYTDAVDVGLNYRINLNQEWSLLPRLGYTHQRTKQKRYSETELGGASTAIAGFNAHTNEIYGGVKAEGNWQTRWGYCGFSAAYDFGAECGKSGYKSEVSLTTNGSDVAGFSLNKQQATHYLSLESNFFHQPSQLKYSLKYMGGYGSYGQNHAVVAGVHYKF